MISHLAPHTANKGKYLEAPQETVDKFRHVEDSNRRTYAGMIIIYDCITAGRDCSDVFKNYHLEDGWD